jgi:hypothetical protein
MAKAAKSPDGEITEARAKKFRADVLERHERIESAKGTYMNRARQEREAIQTLVEGLTQFGISNKVAKLNIKIAIWTERIAGWYADLEVEQRKQVVKLAKAQGDKKQLSLFGDLPKHEKPSRHNVVQMEMEPMGAA